MAPPLEFAPRRPRTPKRPPALPKKLLGNKLQELAARSPRDLAAIETLTDYLLGQLDQPDHKRA